MSSDAIVISQWAAMVRAGHSFNFDFSFLSKPVQVEFQRLMEITARSGGPLASTMDRLGRVLNVREQTTAELQIAVAGPKASTRLVLALPILVFVGAGISGLPVLTVVLETPVALLSMALGLILYLLGNRWTKRILLKAEPTDTDPGNSYDSIAIAVEAGLPLFEAAKCAGEELSPELFELQEVSQSTGIALTESLRNLADSVRSERFQQDRLRIQKASVSLLWPLGVTVLPAFVLVAIVPIAIALMKGS
jgi:tight adherence protein B